jgi:hypothetical protein
LAAVFSGDGLQNAAARADHEHLAGIASSVGVGGGALGSNTGAGNSALGTFALASNVAGANNTAIGFNAHSIGANNNDNTAVGSHALRATLGSGNTAVGSFASNSNTSGSQNTAVGALALTGTTTGSNNVAVGASAMDQVTSGAGNVGIGSNALGLLATGHANTAVGQAAGGSAGTGVTSGSEVTLIGALTAAAAGRQNATAIGARALVDQDHSLVLGSIDGVNGATDDTRVGIGTTTPDAFLEIASESFPTAIFGHYSNQPTSFPRLQMRRARGSRTAPAAVLANDVIGSIDATGHTGAGFTVGRAGISFRAAENWSSGGGTGTRIVFSTTQIGELINPTEQMVIDHDGLVGIGVTDPARKLDVNGNIRVGAIGNPWGCVEDRGGSIIAGTACSSDRRLKRDIAPFAPALDHVAALRPVHFYWRAEEFPERAFGASESFGLIAQEVEAVLPELVTTDADGYKAVNYSKLPLLAIQAIRELKDRVDRLDEENAVLERRLAALEALIAPVASRTPDRPARVSGRIP